MPPSPSQSLQAAADLVRKALEPAFSVDESDRIVEWNPLAERVLQRPAEEAVDLEADGVLETLDLFGNRLSRTGLHEMVRRREIIHPFEADVRKGDGSRTRMRIDSVLVPGYHPHRYYLVHRLHEVRRRRSSDYGASAEPSIASAAAGRLGFRAAAAGDSGVDLTPREIEVLRELARGASTRAIAQRLSITPSTTRNHIQNVLSKLEVHSRVEAVSLALRTRLI